MFKSSTRCLFRMIALSIAYEAVMAIHNVIAHPLMTLLRILSLFGVVKKVEEAGKWFHDVTVPNEDRLTNAKVDYLCALAHEKIQADATAAEAAGSQHAAESSVESGGVSSFEESVGQPADNREDSRHNMSVTA